MDKEGAAVALLAASSYVEKEFCDHVPKGYMLMENIAECLGVIKDELLAALKDAGLIIFTKSKSTGKPVWSVNRKNARPHKHYIRHTYYNMLFWNIEELAPHIINIRRKHYNHYTKKESR